MSVAEYKTQFTKLSKFALDLVITEKKRKRRFIQELILEIQETLAAAPISTFGEALERAQMIENAKSQLKAFQVRKRSVSSSNPEKSRENAPHPKAGRGMGGIRLAPLPPLPQKKFEGVSAGGTQLGKGHHGGSSLGGPVTPPRPACNYCGTGIHTENDCCVQGRKCLLCGSNEHLVKRC